MKKKKGSKKSAKLGWVVNSIEPRPNSKFNVAISDGESTTSFLVSARDLLTYEGFQAAFLEQEGLLIRLPAFEKPKSSRRWLDFLGDFLPRGVSKQPEDSNQAF